jgi:hypothetical protein
MKMRKKLKINKAIAILFVIILTSFTLFAVQSSITGWTINEANVNTLEKEIEIGVLANTFISIKNNNGIQAKLVLDDGTSIPNQEIEFYLNGNLIDKQITDSHDYVQPNFNLSSISIGTYSFRAMSQGDTALYLNPISTEKEIEIKEQEGMKTIGLLSETIENEILLIQNATEIINSTIFKGDNCQKFEENVLWTSKYTNEQKGYTNYEIWRPKYNCSAINENKCIIANIEVNARFLSTDYPELNNSKGGYVRISESNKDSCINPEKANYQMYLAQEIINGEEKKLKKYQNDADYLNYADCFGIELSASQYMLVDVFDVSYTLCTQRRMENEN